MKEFVKQLGSNAKKGAKEGVFAGALVGTMFFTGITLLQLLFRVSDPKEKTKE